MARKIVATLSFLAAFLPTLASAHEVYVLQPDAISRDLAMPPLPVMSIISNNAATFFFWTFICIWAVFTVLSISVSKPLERHLLPTLNKLKRFAPLAARLTVGVAIIFSAYHSALFGPELPLSAFIPAAFIDPFRIVLVILGSFLVLGLLTHIAGAFLILIYAYMWLRYGFYMMTYVNYFGEMLIAFIVGATTFSLDRALNHRIHAYMHGLVSWFEHHAFLIFRVSFGLALIYASVYAKFIHAHLALDTVTTYHLTTYLPFDPSFIVLGAFAIEILLGIFFILGIEIRFASLFLLFFLTLSLLYFKESVWPHVVLAGGAITIFLRGYDRFTLELGFLRRGKRRAREPVL